LHTLSRIYTDLYVQYAMHVIYACKQSELPYVQIVFQQKKSG